MRLLLGPLIAGILLVLPAPEGLSPDGWRVAAVGIWMALWWMTEAVPLAATSLLPIVLLPLLGVGTIREATGPYANPLIFLFLGGFLVALGMEKWGLHRRLALNMIARTGTRPAGIVAGFMVSAAVLSMWISNTATALMMLPIALSVADLGRFPDDDAPTRFGLVLMLAIAYACSIGGLGTLIGTPTNALLAAFMSETYQIEIGFAQWMLVGVPLVVVGLTVSFVVLTRFVHPLGKTELPGGAAYVREELNTLGGMSRDESWIAGVFAVTAVLWMTRPLLSGVVPGLSDTGIAIGAGVLLFALPSSQGGRLLDWETARRLPWGVLLLFGGGLSLAAAIKNSGLAVWIGTQLAGLDTWPPVLLVLLVLVVVILLTELTSNTATAAAFLPVLAGLADVLGTTPLQLLVPATLAASCAFMLPVATPPNAIVYGSGQVTITQMARAGVWLNLAFVGLVLALTFTLVPAVF